MNLLTVTSHMSGLSETGFGHLGTDEVTKRRYGPDERTLARRARINPVVAVLQQSRGAAPANQRHSATARVSERRRLRVGWQQQLEDGCMAIQNWCDAPEIHPSQIRVGDIIGTLHPTPTRLTVKLISGPKTTPRRWTFFSRDAKGQQYTDTFAEDDLVRRYGKA
jgi:hypothetical protein